MDDLSILYNPVAGFPALRSRKFEDGNIYDCVMGRRTVGYELVYTDGKCLCGLWICIEGLPIWIHWGRKALILYLQRHSAGHWCMFNSKLRTEVLNPQKRNRAHNVLPNPYERSKIFLNNKKSTFWIILLFCLSSPFQLNSHKPFSWYLLGFSLSQE